MESITLPTQRTLLLNDKIFLRAGAIANSNNGHNATSTICCTHGVLYYFAIVKSNYKFEHKHIYMLHDDDDDDKSY
jgi:hypothetical protein